jgi:hypothetical protein
MGSEQIGWGHKLLGILFTDEANFYVNGEESPKRTLLEQYQPTLDGSVKGARCWKSNGVVRDMRQQNCQTCFL